MSSRKRYGIFTLWHIATEGWRVMGVFARMQGREALWSCTTSSSWPFMLRETGTWLARTIRPHGICRFLGASHPHLQPNSQPFSLLNARIGSSFEHDLERDALQTVQVSVPHPTFSRGSWSSGTLGTAVFCVQRPTRARAFHIFWANYPFAVCLAFASSAVTMRYDGFVTTGAARHEAIPRCSL